MDEAGHEAGHEAGQGPPWQPFQVEAVNAETHAGNPIHTDAGARAAGYPSALVAGVTTYAYLTHPLVVRWGAAWLERGTANVRFRSPVFAGDRLVCEPVDVPAIEPTGAADPTDPVVGSVAVAARVAGDERPRAEATATLADRPPVPPDALRPGEPLSSVRLALVGEHGDAYGSAVGDPLDVHARHGLVHPAVWVLLANHVVHRQVARGQWIHVRSAIAHHGAAAIGTEVEVHAAVVERFRRGGERAILDVRIESADGVLATVEHEAIVALDG